MRGPPGRYPVGMKRSLGIIAALVLTLTAACGSDNKASESPSPSQATSVESSEPDGEGPLRFGESHEFLGGIVVSIGKPVEFKATEDSIAGDPSEWAHYITFTVRITNGDTQFDPSEGVFTINDGIQEGEEMYGAAVDGLPSTALTPKREVSFKMGFGVDALDDLVLEYTPGSDGESVVYASK